MPKINYDTSLKEFLDDSRILLDRCLDIMAKKNHDYSDSADVFSNFEDSADIAHVTPAQVALIQIGNKISRLSQLVGEGKEPLNESAEDTLVDLINYALILRGMLKENGFPPSRE
jgi:hypothetical protein